MEKKRTKREWLIELRKAKGMTVREIAPLMDMSFSHLSDIENGRRNPSIDLSMKMAKFYGVDLNKFFTDRVRFSEKAN
jgi:transcriptional regulator with XRE-family HTH domain